MLVVTALALFWVPSSLALAFGAGYGSHLVADGISPMGEPFLWPLPWRIRLMPWRRLRVHSGTRLVELPIALALLFVCLAVRP